MELDSKPKTSVTEVVQKEIEKQLKLVGRIKPHPGHTLYEVNVKTLEFKAAEFEESEVSYEDAKNKNLRKRRKVITKPDHVYISALNPKNVFKILVRDYGLKIKES